MNKRLIQHILRIAIWVVILIGLGGAIPLVYAEIVEGNICPKMVGIPACFIILSYLVLAIISNTRIFKDRNILYFIGVIMALSIATFGSVGNLLGYIECPITENGTPMCYLSFLLFLSLLVLKIIINRK